MTIEQAARSLEQRFGSAPWYTAVGVGERAGQPVLFLYVKTARNPVAGEVRDGWEGYPVEVRRMGSPRIMAG